MVSTSPRSGAKKARKRYSWCRYDVQVMTLLRCYLGFDMTSYSTAREPNEIDNVPNVHLTNTPGRLLKSH